MRQREGASSSSIRGASTDPGTNYLYSISGSGNTLLDGGVNCYYPSVEPCTGTVNIAPVGTAILGAGYWGQLDLDGEVTGWTMDYVSNYVNPCNDCAFLSPTMGRTNRSGLYYQLVAATTNYRGALDLPLIPDGSLYLSPGIGVRCARAP